MSEAVDYAEVRGFLEAQGYEVVSFLGGDSIEISWHDNLTEFSNYGSLNYAGHVYKTALNDFLSHWLGVKWKDVWSRISQDELAIFGLFDGEEYLAIRQAIRYYEALS